ncbi:MAG: adenine phosphoribosyltransferase [Thermoplasmata archaeon]|nr:adenine phosphoribosyltransferase [Thermoplasmata archaeon]
MEQEEADPDLELLLESFGGVPIVVRGDYHYFVHPLSDGIPSIHPDLIGAAARLMAPLMPPPERYDLILTAEAMGIPLTTVLSTMVGKPMSIIRKREYGLHGEVSLGQKTGYSENRLFMNLPEGPAGRVLIVDDVLSTGGTLGAMVEGVRSSGWAVESCLILFDKMGDEGKAELEEMWGFPITTLLHVDVVEGRCIVNGRRR